MDTLIPEAGGQPVEELELHNPEGERLGAYRILRALGRGGMGSVYLALRDDDQYRQQVALKIVKPGLDTADVLCRFRRERQILAGLEHRYIARLLDGGCTPEGRPYLVMELVHGHPITEYCRDRKLGIEARCRLFLKVCEAVSFTHRKLVVHRDLKPANILVAADGSPKVLDFGLAEILAGDSHSAFTFSPGGYLTPEYASPEQIRGGPLSTASDVYSLGVILYELLTGHPPCRVNSAAPAVWEQAVCESAVTRPSAAPIDAPDSPRWRRKLQGDLDNIVMLALRKETDRRYRSVDELASDIRNYLELRPVRAGPDSLWHRTAKFARRRRFVLLPAAGVLASLVGGLLIAIGQAHSAEAARHLALAHQEESQLARQAADAEHRRAEKERDLAIASRHVAEERVAQMVDLSDRSLSQVYSLMERLAGGLAARRELIGTTLDFLEKLSTDAGSDARLRVALAKAYMRLGDIQSDPSGATMGGWDGALQSYRAGSALLADAPRQSAPGDGGMLVWLDLQEKIGLLLGQMGHTGNAQVLLRDAIAVLERMGARASGKELPRRRACLYLALSKETHPDLAASRPFVETSIALLSALSRQYPADAEIRYDLSRAYTERGYLVVNLDGANAASPDYETVVELREQLVKEHPTDTVYRRVLVGAYDHAAQIDIYLRQTDAARAYYQRALAMAKADSADPQDLQAAGDYGSELMSLSKLDEQTGSSAAALAGARRAIAVLEPVIAVASRSRYALVLAEAHEHAGAELSRMGNDQEGIADFRRAQSVADSYVTAYPADGGAFEQFVNASRTLIQALTAGGDRQNAFEQANALLRRAERSQGVANNARSVERSLAQAYLSLGGVNGALERWGPAQDAAQEAIRHASLASPSSARNSGLGSALLQEARALAAECSRKLAEVN
jgi:tetratricopeptide (TPR) repeat protein